LQDLVQEAQSFKEQANQLFAEKQYEQAILTYSEALNCLPPRPKRSKEEGEEHELGDEKQSVLTSTIAKGKQRAVEESEGEKAARLLRAVVYANLAACHWKLEEYKETVVACNEALQDDAYYVKALHRRAQANEQIKTWSSLSSAMEDYKTIEGLSQCPASLLPSLRASIKRLQPEIDEVSAREKDEMLGKLKGVGDSVLGWFGLSTDNFQMQKGEGGGYSLNFVR
jgi:tetratricopeptide (TPR) repeat protein